MLKHYSIGIDVDENQFYVTELMKYRQKVHVTHSASGENLSVLLPKRKTSTLAVSVPDDCTSKKILSINKHISSDKIAHDIQNNNPSPYTDFIVLDEKKQSLNILLITAKSTAIDRRIKTLKQENLKPTIVTSDMHSIMNYLTTFENDVEKNDVVAIILVKSKNVACAIIADNHIVFFRSNAHKDSGSLQKTVQKSLDIFILSSHYKHINKLYYCGSIHLESSFNNIKIATISALPNMSHILAAQGFVGDEKNINFLPWRTVKKTRDKKKFYAALGILSFIHLTALSYLHIKQEIKITKQQTINQKLMRKTKSISKIQNQIIQTKEKQNELKNKINALGKSSSGQIITTLLQLMRRIPSTATLEKISYRDKTFIVSGFSRSHKDIIFMEKTFNISRLLKDDDGQIIHFSLELPL